jgi:hypothetical protein
MLFVPASDVTRGERFIWTHERRSSVWRDVVEFSGIEECIDFPSDPEDD